MTDTKQDNTLISIDNLKTYFKTMDGTVRAVDGVTFEINKGEALGLVGESGCGKSVTAFSILRLLPNTARIADGTIQYHRSEGEVIDLTQVDPNGGLIRSIRGNEIAMIFQEPLTSLSPVHTVGSQISEAVQLHQSADAEQARARAIEMLEQVGIASPKQRYEEYPHHFSGGMRQRAMIAMALSCNPQLLIADEPTTALDVTIQAQILELMKFLQDELGMAILMITHNLGVIAQVADEIAVMYLGKILERGTANEIIHQPQHPYTQALLKAIPQLDQLGGRLKAIGGDIPSPLARPTGCPSSAPGSAS